MSDIETRLFINGEFVPAAEGKTFTLINPATEVKVADIQIASKADVDRAVKCAQAAQPAWANLAASARAACITKLADLVAMPKHTQRLMELDSIAMGKPIGMSGIDIGASISRLRFDAHLAETLVGESSLLSPGSLNLVLRQPYGITAAIIPWNVPLIMWVSKVAPSVAAGNTMLIKSSEKSPLAALYIAGLTVEAGFPPGVIQSISGLGDTGKLLSEHMEIRKISFTGSTRTGRFVACGAAMSNLKAVALELGGKSPTIIFDDADLDQAVPACAFSINWNSGQICIASSRLYVHEKIAAEFMAKFKVAMGTFKHGDPLDASTTMGPQADDIQGKAVLEHIAVGKKEGKLEMGGNRVGDKGYFIHPTIFTGVPESSSINKQEVFGPVVIIHTFSDEDEAIRRANDTEYGLYAAVFTKNIDRAIRVAKALEAGTVGVNATSPSTSSELPFGGWKTSGQGREGGTDSLIRWTEEKSVFIKYT
ncbi:hypothetical protein RQP46_001817 [Phenoliferia psychrophenolica]